MRDLLPTDVRLRMALLTTLQRVYESYGFDQIETPALEEIDRLLDSEAGDNEKLIYKVMRRGLDLTGAHKTESELVDLGLRYDLTVPLARFYATHSALLPKPFRAIQTGPVWRAERPQKGRYRQFVQCDIDVIGDAGTDAEVDLVCATAEALRAVEVGEFTVRVNDRRLLQALVKSAGFSFEDTPAVLVIIDKLDKIGFESVEAELSQISAEPASALIKQLAAVVGSLTADEVAETLGNAAPSTAIADLRSICAGVVAVLPWVNIRVDATLVRGQGYYTGSIFEVEHDDLSGSLAGGGRYDKMIAKLSGVDVAAVGFSIGFERLFDIVSQRAATPNGQARVVLLYSDETDYISVATAAQGLRNANFSVRPEQSAKNRTSQLTRLERAGFTHWTELRNGSLNEPQQFAQ